MHVAADFIIDRISHYGGDTPGHAFSVTQNGVIVAMTPRYSVTTHPTSLRVMDMALRALYDYMMNDGFTGVSYTVNDGYNEVAQGFIDLVTNVKAGSR